MNVHTRLYSRTSFIYHVCLTKCSRRPPISAVSQIYVRYILLAFVVASEVQEVFTITQSTAGCKSPEVHQQTENDKTEVSPVGSTSLSHESHIKAIDNPLFPEHCRITHILYFLFYFTTTTKEPSCLLFVLFTGIYQREAVKSRSTGRDCKPEYLNRYALPPLK